MENNKVSMHFEIESLTIGKSEINGANIDISTDDAETANKLMYMLEIASAIIANQYITERKK